MVLLDEITGLIYKYACYPKPAHWSRGDQTFNISYYLTNPGSGPWILNNIKSLDSYYYLKRIVTNETPYLIDILNKMCEGVYTITNPDLIEHIAGNKYGYKLALELLDRERKLELSYNVICKILSCITDFSTRKDIEKYKNLENCYAHIDEKLYESYATNPYTFDIFLSKVPKEKILVDKYIHHIARNTAKEAIKIISDNVDVFINQAPEFMQNPAAHEIIKKLIENHIITSQTQGIYNLSKNSNPLVITLLTSYPELISNHISSNSLDEAINIIEDYPHFINWDLLSSNTNPRIIPLLKANRDKVTSSIDSNPLIFRPINSAPKFINKVKQILILEQAVRHEKIKQELEYQTQLTHTLNKML